MEVRGISSGHGHIRYWIGGGGVLVALAPGLRIAGQSIPADSLIPYHAGPFAEFALTASLEPMRDVAARRPI
jgi:hypothetical protein